MAWVWLSMAWCHFPRRAWTRPRLFQYAASCGNSAVNVARRSRASPKACSASRVRPPASRVEPYRPVHVRQAVAVDTTHARKVGCQFLGNLERLPVGLCPWAAYSPRTDRRVEHKHASRIRGNRRRLTTRAAILGIEQLSSCKRSRPSGVRWRHDRHRPGRSNPVRGRVLPVVPVAPQAAVRNFARESAEEAPPRVAIPRCVDRHSHGETVRLASSMAIASR